MPETGARESKSSSMLFVKAVLDGAMYAYKSKIVRWIAFGGAVCGAIDGLSAR